MEVILKQDIKTLGNKDEIVKVKNGYGTNYLIPKGMATLANESNKKAHTEILKQRAFKEEKLKNDAQAIANSLQKVVVKVGAKVGESGKIFGSVNTIQLADALKKLGFTIDKKQISLDEEGIKALGTYTAGIDLHKDLKVKVNFEVVEE